MKQVTIHWVEMRIMEIPEQCPTGSFNSMLDWLASQSPCDTPYGHDLENFTISRDTRDFEIVSVEKEEPSNNK